MSKIRSRIPAIAVLLCAATALAQAPGDSAGQPKAQPAGEEALVRLDFQNADLQDVVNSMAGILKKRFVFDERVRGEITVVSEEPITVKQAYLMFESILELKGFTIIEGPSGELKIVPSRDAPGSALPFEEGGRPANRAQFITRQIRLKYVKVDTVQDTLRQLSSKDARLIADQRTNSLIVTDLAANIRRIMNIIDKIDVATYEEQVKVIELQYADAAELTTQLQNVFGSQASKERASFRAQTAAAFAAARAAASGGVVDAGGDGSFVGGTGEPRFTPVPRTNSIIVIAPQSTIDQVSKMVTLLDYKRPGRGSINIYKLKNATAEDVAETLASLASGQSPNRRSSSGSSNSASNGGTNALASLGGSAPAPTSSGSGGMSQVAELEGGARVTADADTNSLIIQATPEAYAALVDVIQELDTRRPQVMMEAAILEVRVRKGDQKGANLLFNLDGRAAGFSSTPSATADGGVVFPDGTQSLQTASGLAGAAGSFFNTAIIGRTVNVRNAAGQMVETPVIAAILAAAQSDEDTNVLSTPKLLTADNEEAQIKVGETRGFPVSQLAAINPGTTPVATPTANNGNFQTSTQIQRQDVGVTMRITPQISEGDSVRMKIFTEITNVTDATNPFGPTTSNRSIENTVYVKDGEAVMIGGIIMDQLDSGVRKVPFLGDLPALGWLFRNETKGIVKTNLIMVLTPRIVRDPADLEQITVEGREKFRAASESSLEFKKEETDQRKKAKQAGLDLPQDSNPVRRELSTLTSRYPVDKLPELREEKQIREEERKQKLEQESRAPGGNYLVQVALLDKPEDAVTLLEKLMKQGYDGVVLSREDNGRTFHYVQLGPYPNEADAQKVGREVKADTGFSTYVMIEP